MERTKSSDILELGPSELAERLSDAGEPRYRTEQVRQWLYEKFALGFEEMSNLPAALRARLAEEFIIDGLRRLEVLHSKDGETRKFVFAGADGERVESVLMGDEGRATFCISCQAGCAAGCDFCATGAGGFRRDLATGEILGQVQSLAREAGRLGNVVFMGMGEPLLNLDAVLAAMRALCDEGRYGLGERRITVSTAGVTPGIHRLAKSGLRPYLALSLNSPFDEQRSDLMPLNRRYPLAEVLDACDDYAERTGRRLMLEYVLLGGTNTSQKAARATARIARRLGALVNLIRFNPFEGAGHAQPTDEEVARFRAVLEAGGVAVTERFRRGRDIAAGCGQLAAAAAKDRGT